MSAGIDVVNVAAQELGYIEGPNNDNKYGQWYGLNNQPYCAMFVSYVFAQAGLSKLVAASTDKGFSYCSAGLTWFQKQGCVVNKYAGQPGDLVFFSWSNTGVPDHVGIIVAASKDGITTIEGNTGPDNATGSQTDGIGVFRRHRPYLHVMAIVRPKYPSPVAPSKGVGQNKGLAAGVAGATAIGGGGVAAVNNHSTTPPAKAPTVIVAPPFPGTAAFKAGSKGTAQYIVAKALANAGLLPASMVSNVLTAEELTLVPAYQLRYPGLKGHKGIDLKTYVSMVAKANG